VYRAGLDKEDFGMRTVIAIPFIMVLTGTVQPTGLLFRTPAPITKVSVLDAGFELVKVLTPVELAAFRRHWENKKEVKGSFSRSSISKLGGEHFKLDIERQHSDARWLYQTTGYVQLVSKQVKPKYKLQDPKAFNRLIGAAK
jgi:hypothetical protein